MVVSVRGWVYSSPEAGTTIAAQSSRSSCTTRYVDPAMQVDRARVHDLERPALVDRADQRAVGQHDAVLDATEPLRSPIPCAGKPRAGPHAADVTPIRSEPLTQQEPVVEHQAAHGVVEVVTPVAGVVVAERMLEGRAGEMGVEDESVGGVDHCRLGRSAEHLRGMRHQVLVELILAGHQHGQRGLLLASGAARLLPHRGDRPGEAVEHAGVEPTDVHPELERGGGDDTPQPSGEQLRLDLAPLAREVAAAVRAHGARPAPEGSRRLTSAATSSVPLRLRQNVSVRKSWVTSSAMRSAAVGVGRRSSAGCLVDQRRVPQREQPLAPRRAVVGDLGHVESAQSARPVRPDVRSSPSRTRTSGVDP